jgi:hypothetical protein
MSNLYIFIAGMFITAIVGFGILKESILIMKK